MSKVVERTKEVLQDGGKGRDDYSVLVSVRFSLRVLRYSTVSFLAHGTLTLTLTLTLSFPPSLPPSDRYAESCQRRSPRMSTEVLPVRGCLTPTHCPVSCVVCRVLALLFSSLQVKWLSFLGGVLIELSGRQASIPRASGIAKEICPLLVEGLDHPFKACREEIAR